MKMRKKIYQTPVTSCLFDKYIETRKKKKTEADKELP